MCLALPAVELPAYSPRSVETQKSPAEFFAGSTPELRRASLGFFIAAAGVALAFIISAIDDYGAGNPFAWLAVAIVAVGIGVSWVAVLGGFFKMLRDLFKMFSRSARRRRPRPPA
jgi:hypothetical protein